MVRGVGGPWGRAQSCHARLRRLKEKHQKKTRDLQNATATLQFLLQQLTIEQGQLQQMQQVHAAAQAVLEIDVAHVAASHNRNPTASKARAVVPTDLETADADVLTRPESNPTLGKEVHPTHGQLEQPPPLALETADDKVLVPAKSKATEAGRFVASTITDSKSVAIPGAETHDADNSAACK